MGTLTGIKFAELRIPVDPNDPTGAYYVVLLNSTLDAVYDGDTGETLAAILSRVNQYGVCGTAAATTAKTITLDGFTLATNARVTVKFSNGNSAASPTLNVNGTGAKALFYQGVRVTDSTAIIKKGGVYDLIYDGTNYEFIGNIATGYGY